MNANVIVSITDKDLYVTIMLYYNSTLLAYYHTLSVNRN